MGKFVINRNFVIREVSGSTVMLNRITGDYFGLNEVGTDFIHLLKEEPDLDMVISRLLSLYDISEEVLRQDINELVEKMVERSILIKPTFH